VAIRKEFVLISYSDKPTGAQLIKDEAFVNSVRNELRPALLSELESRFVGFCKMHLAKKLNCLIEDNDKYTGKGDSLPIEYGPVVFNAYSNVVLGGKPESSIFTTKVRQKNHRVKWRRPFFVNKVSNKTFSERDNWFYSQIKESDLKRYLYEDNFHSLYSGQSLPAYSTLPITFKVALLCRYMSEHIIATPSAITAFVLDDIDTIETFRYIFEPTEDASGMVNGWVIRIHDVRPSQAFGIQIAEQIKSFVEKTESDDEQFGYSLAPNLSNSGLSTHQLKSQFEPKDKRRKRATPEETQEVIAFVDDLKAKGYVIGRGGNISWDEVAAKLAERTEGEINRTGKNLKDSYASFKKRHGNLS